MLRKPHIQQTDKYDQFKTILGNRQISTEHISNLVREIQQCDLLAACPIIVNEKMEIIDGQHRLEAAKRLKIPIYYVQSPGLDIKQIVKLNNSQKRWKVWDYIELHIKYGNEQYAKLKDFVTRHRLTPSIGIQLLGKRSMTSFHSRLFREGEFMVEDEAFAEQIAQTHALSGLFRIPSIRTNDAFIAAFKRTAQKLEKEGHTMEVLTDALLKKKDVIENYTQTKHYLRDFEQALAKQKVKLRLY